MFERRETRPFSARFSPVPVLLQHFISPPPKQALTISLSPPNGASNPSALSKEASPIDIPTSYSRKASLSPFSSSSLKTSSSSSSPVTSKPSFSSSSSFKKSIPSSSSSSFKKSNSSSSSSFKKSISSSSSKPSSSCSWQLHKQAASLENMLGIRNRGSVCRVKAAGARLFKTATPVRIKTVGGCGTLEYSYTNKPCQTVHQQSALRDYKPHQMEEGGFLTIKKLEYQSRRRLVPAVVGFDEDAPDSNNEEAWQKGFEQAHSKKGEENGGDTSYVNFVRSYQGSSSRSSNSNLNGKPQQAWADSPKDQKRQKTNVKVPYQSPSSTRRSSKDDQQYEISAMPRQVMSRGGGLNRSTLDQEQTIIKPISDLRRKASCTVRDIVIRLEMAEDTGDKGPTSPTTPPEIKPGEMEEEILVEVPIMIGMFEKSTQTGPNESVTMERSYERAPEDRTGIKTCDTGVQTHAPRLVKPPVTGDFFQKENREDALKNKQTKLTRKQRKTSATIDLTQPRFKEIPDFNMANWVQSRILVSAQSARYELPMDMHVLSKLSPLEYLTEYAIICKRRQALYKLIFSKYDRERKNFLKRSQTISGLREIHLGSASDHEISAILKLINVEENFKIDFRFFCSIAAFSERVLSRWMILPGGVMTEKETIEKADFTNLTWKLEGVEITNHMQQVLYAL